MSEILNPIPNEYKHTDEAISHAKAIGLLV